MSSEDKGTHQNQHFVPKMLLRNFMGDNGALYMFDKCSRGKGIKRTSLDKAFSELNLYTLYKNGERDLSLEENLSRAEAKVGGIIKKIIKAGRAEKPKPPNLKPEEKLTLFWFMSCQWGRVPKTTYPILNKSVERSFSENPLLQELSDEKKEEFKKGIWRESVDFDTKGPNEEILSELENDKKLIGEIRALLENKDRRCEDPETITRKILSKLGNGVPTGRGYSGFENLTEKIWLQIEREGLIESLRGEKDAVRELVDKKIFRYVRSYRLSLLKNKGLRIEIIRKNTKSFVIGSNPTLRTSHLADPSSEFWLPIAHDIAVAAYGSRHTEEISELEDQKICSLNEKIFKRSTKIAGRSKKLLCSLSNKR